MNGSHSMCDIDTNSFNFKRLLVFDPNKNFDLKSFIKFLIKEKFPLSQVYFFGDSKQTRLQFKRRFFPYFIDFEEYLPLFKNVFFKDKKLYLYFSNPDNTFHTLQNLFQYNLNISHIECFINLLNKRPIFELMAFKNFTLVHKEESGKTLWQKD